MLIPAVLILIVSLIGGVLFARGLIGRRVGDHVYCRRCGYDLHGQPDSSQVCPECGQALFLSTSRVIGQHERRGRLLVVGGLLLLVGLTSGGIILTALARGVDLYRTMPAFWLLHEASASTPDGHAIAELTRRISLGTLSDGSLHRAVAAGLAFQASNSTWDPLWGNLIEAADIAGKTTKRELQTYHEQSIQPTLKMRSRINFDRPLTVDAAFLPIKTGKRGAQMRFTAINPRIDGRPIKGTASLDIGAYAGGMGYTSSANLVVGNDPPLAAGEHTLEADLSTFWQHKLGVVGTPWPDSQADAAAVIPFKQTFIVLPADQPLTMVTIDPSQRQAMHDSIKVYAFIGSAGEVVLNLNANNAPVAVSSELIAISPDGQTVVTGQINLAPGGNFSTGLQAEHPTPLHHGDKIDVIIIAPKPKKLDQRTSDEKVWGEELDYRGVVIE